jgi:dipeptidase E
MRLYLSSYRMGDRAGALLALLGSGKRAALIQNGLDSISPAARQIYREEVYDPRAELNSLGITAEELDLRRFFGRTHALADTLSTFDLVWVTGGNAFVLRRAMRQSGFDTVIGDMLDRDAIVYGGFSAGAAVAGPSLRGYELMDDYHELPTGYTSSPVWDGLGFVDFCVVPHYRSAHPETDAAERLARHLHARRIEHRTLRDGEAIVWTGARAMLPVELRSIA